VDLGHDTQHALATVVDLVNTAEDPPGDDALADVDALRRFVDVWQISEVGDLTEEDLAAVRRLRGRFREVFLAGTQPQAAELVNAIVSDARTTPRLTDHDGYDWHVHYFAPGATLAEHLAADCGMALAFVLAAGERDRLRVCEAPNCERVLVDLSRNRSRRYCDSRTCGNRLHVAAYRERRRAAAG
jgi:predicted RNA-binding Zn ribbon-like protein